MQLTPTAPPSQASTAPEHLLVCVMADGQAQAMLEQGRRLQRAHGCDWSVLGLDLSEAAPETRAHLAELLQVLDQAEREGAHVQRLGIGSASPREILSAVAEHARKVEASSLLIGRPHLDSLRWRSPLESLSRLADELGARLPDVDIQVLALGRPAGGRSSPPRQTRRLTWPRLQDWFWVSIVLLLCTLVGFAMEPVFVPSNLIMVYLAGVTYIALRRGGAAALLATVGSTLLFYLMFVPPRWSLIPTDPQYSFTFAVMLAVGLVISRLAARSRHQARAAEARSRRAQALNQCGLRLAQARTAEAVAEAVSAAVSQASGQPARLHVLDAQGHLSETEAIEHRSLAERSLAERRETGAGTAIEPQATRRFIPLLGAPGPLGLLAVCPPPEDDKRVEEEHLLRAFANQASLALERVVYERRSAEAAVATEAERLRNTLLTGVSHDFRTPLTTIVGSVSSLLEQGHALDDAQRQLLLTGVLDQARHLHALTSDLLDMARMEGGALQPNPEWCPADELVAESVAALGSRLASQRLQLQVPADTIVWCDPRLLNQALSNLLDNALRHSPAGGGIRVAIHADTSHWVLEVQDEGPGVPAGLEHEVFKKFYRGPGGGDAIAAGGSGLGLAICAAVAQLHGGRIEVSSGPGACFRMQLPQAGSAPREDA